MLFKISDFRALLILLVAATSLWLPRLRGPIDLRFDAGVYYLLGTSLADGNGYRITSEPGNMQAVQYPPMLPLIVAAEAKLAGTTDPAVLGRWLRWTYCLLFIAYVLSAYAVARICLRPAFALLAGLLCCLSLHSFFLSDLLFAELPFALASTLFFLLLHRSSIASSPTTQRLSGAGAAGLATVAFLLRSSGIALLAAWAGESLLRRRWKQFALRALVAAVPVLSWQAYLGHVMDSAEFQQPAYAYQRAPYQFYNVTYGANIRLVDPFMPEKGLLSAGGLVGRIAGNAALMPRGLGESVSASSAFGKWLLSIIHDKAHLSSELSPALVNVPLTVVGVVVIAGLVLLPFRGQWFIPLYVALSVGLICLTPWPGQFSRYLAPLNPFLATCFILALTTAYGRAGPRSKGARRAVAGAGAAVVLGAFALQAFAITATFAKRFQPVHSSAGPTSDSSAQKLFFYDQKWADFDAAVEWLAGHARSDDVVAASAPHWVYVKSGRRAVMPPMEADRAITQALLDGVPAAYVIIDSLEFLDVVPRYTRPVVEGRPDVWRAVYEAPGKAAVVYQRVTSGEK